jgi:NhaP-type Na+/H+ or K+/H+ antiporter
MLKKIPAEWRAALYVATVLVVVASFVLHWATPGQWADALSLAAQILAIGSGTVAKANVTPDVPPTEG